MSTFHWHCPFCNRDTTINPDRYSEFTNSFNDGNKYGVQFVHTFLVTCPNHECREYTLTVSLRDAVKGSNPSRPAMEKQSWQLIPQANVRVFPKYVPAPVLQDYREACLIRELSPKASATLSRRCLQGIIRDFWKVSMPRLVDEIDAIADKVDQVTWKAIDGVRTLGNIGAHMEKDINAVVDVDPDEAGLLIGLIETLITEWYVGRFEREQRITALIAAAGAKKAAPSSTKP